MKKIKEKIKNVCDVILRRPAGRREDLSSSSCHSSPSRVIPGLTRNLGFLKKLWKKIKTSLAENMQNPRRKRKMIFAMVLFGTVGSFGIYALAQSVLDSFLDATKIAKNWNVDMTGGEIKLQTRTCDNVNYFCGLPTTCANTLGDGQYILVKRANEAATKMWKTTATACDKPQCGIAGGQDGDNLVADNTLDFSLYPARDACKAIGARLPTLAELNCMYTNRASFGNNFGAGSLWSGTESSVPNAWVVNFASGSPTTSSKGFNNSVRCVVGW